MNFLKFKILIFLISQFVILNVTNAQNDECVDAIPLSNIHNYCSNFGEFSTINATNSETPTSSCYFYNENMIDVWFSFTATENFLYIEINGDNTVNQGGTLLRPQFTLFGGTCQNLVPIGCLTDEFNTNSVSRYLGPLVPGETYYISVGSDTEIRGSFQLCLNNYNQEILPEGDCSNATILCDKASVYIEKLGGVGNNSNEIPNGLCFITEESSAWFKWTCAKSGTLVFDLIPIELDDIDFILFELPNGIVNCNNKIPLRCGAAGQNTDQNGNPTPIEDWIHCYGSTGLNFTSTDFSEIGGCSNNQDRYVRYVDLVEGKSYALLVNNFSVSGSGFNMTFDGTAEFLGARADFELGNLNCFEDTIYFNNTSLEPTDSIISYSWNFGNTALPMTSDLENPDGVLYSSPGHKTITLTVTSEDGCVDTQTKNIFAECCDDPLSVTLSSDNNTIKLGEIIEISSDVENAEGTIVYNWYPTNAFTGCITCPEAYLQQIDDTVTYLLVIYDEKGCSAKDSIRIRTIKPYNVFVPNIFTPNFDGINDFFNGYGFKDLKLVKSIRVYNRWEL